MSYDSQREVLEHRSGTSSNRVLQWIRRITLPAVAVGLAGALGMSVPLSGQPLAPKPQDGLSEQNREQPSTSAPGILVQRAFDVVRYGPRGVTRLARLPAGFGAGRLWAVDDAGYPAVLYGVSRRTLFRIDAGSGEVVADIGTVERIVGAGPNPGELVVQVSSGKDSTLVAMTAATGDVVDREPFPGFNRSGNWTPRGVMKAFGVPGVVLTRPVGDGRNDVAVAWSELGVASGFVPSRLQTFGRLGRLLGIADEWALFLPGDCPSATCSLAVLSFSRDGATVGEVRPPPGWSFADGMAGGSSHEVLVPLVNLADDSVHALARLVKRGDEALLLHDSIGFEPGPGLLAEPDGSIYFFRTGSGQSRGSRVLARWSPVDLPYIGTFPEFGQVPATGRLVCVCD